MVVRTMEAMTAMGMAASQARFLGLTARKSNVEYQGQQVNQQRTALANESANLYSQMMELTVPTPPSTSDYYTTTYTLDGSQELYSTSDYTIENVTKTYNTDGEYRITLGYTQETRVSKGSQVYKVGQIKMEEGKGKSKKTVTDEDGNKTTVNADLYNINLTIGTGQNLTLHWEDGDADTYTPYKTDEKSNQKILSPQTNYIYEADDKVEGYEAWLSDLSDKDKEGKHYFFKAQNGDYYFLTETDFKTITNTENSNNNKECSIGTTYVKKNAYTVDVLGTLETGSSGRYSAIKIYENDDSDPDALKAPSTIAGKEFSISCKQVMDEDKYNDAYNDYEYEKYKYEKAISDINAQTEIIQHEDQQLELRLDQLDTEQNAIATEMDSVTKVIEDNVEKTFKTFA